MTVTSSPVSRQVRRADAKRAETLRADARNPERVRAQVARVSSGAAVETDAPSIIEFLRLFGDQFDGPSWAAWHAVLKALFALAMTPGELATFRTLTGRTSAPKSPARELWCVCGRRSGKTRIAALIAVFLSTMRTYQLAPGERGVLMVVAADKRQARVARRYVGALLKSVPALAQLVRRETADIVELSTGIAIEVATASFKTTRGFTLIGAIGDEIAFWPTDDAADPDREILAAMRPAMATTQGVLICLSSPYAQRGELYRNHREHFGRDDDPVLVVQGATRAMNPTVAQGFIDQQYAADEASARSEYGAEFRSDVQGYATVEAVQTVTVVGREALPPRRHGDYTAFIDFAGGSGGDSATCAIAHVGVREGLAIAVLDAVMVADPPFSPEKECARFAEGLRAYGITSATADRFAAEFAVEAMGRHDIALFTSERSKSEIYVEFLPLLNSRQVELLDLPSLRSQLLGLERRTTRGGRDSIDHGPRGHDDVINAAPGACVEIMRPWARAGGVGQVVTGERETGAAFDPSDARPSWCDVFHRGVTHTPKPRPSGADRGVGRAKTLDSENIDVTGRQ